MPKPDPLYSIQAFIGDQPTGAPQRPSVFLAAATPIQR